MTMEELWVPTTTHGRVLVQAGSADWLVGFHGYGESAERSFEQLALVPGAATWTVAAIEALHRFYDKRGEVIASWMTRRGREQAIRDNRAYVVSCLESIAAQTGEVPRRLVLMGFSQGASMASRAACAIAQAPRFAAALAAVVTLGGDLAPEIGPDELRRFRSVLLARGDQDTWYDEQKLGADEARLQAAGVPVRTLRYVGGHEWTDEFRAALGQVLTAR